MKWWRKEQEPQELPLKTKEGEEYLCKLSNVSKSYKTPHGKKIILENVSLTVPKENIAILGKNGMGKSTFLRLLAAKEYADSGSIKVNGSISWPVGLTGGFQSSLTGRENVRFVCSIYCLDEQQIQESMRQIEEFCELGDFFDVPIKKYSSGMKARLGFALSLTFKFDVYLVDEVTSVGDIVFRQKAQKAFEQLQQSAHLLMVSHDMKTLKKYCQSALLLHQGQLHYLKNMDEAIERYLSNNYVFET